MKRITQKAVASELGIPESFLHYILNGKRRPSAKRAAVLERKTGIGRMTWLYGSPGRIKKELESTFGPFGVRKKRSLAA